MDAKKRVSVNYMGGSNANAQRRPVLGSRQHLRSPTLSEVRLAVHT